MAQIKKHDGGAALAVFFCIQKRETLAIVKANSFRLGVCYQKATPDQRRNFIDGNGNRQAYQIVSYALAAVAAVHCKPCNFNRW